MPLTECWQTSVLTLSIASWLILSYYREAEEVVQDSGSCRLPPIMLFILTSGRHKNHWSGSLTTVRHTRDIDSAS